MQLPSVITLENISFTEQVVALLHYRNIYKSCQQEFMTNDQLL